MEAFLETVLKQATEQKVLLSSYVTNSSKDGIHCNKCNEISHKKSECTNPKATFACMDIRTLLKRMIKRSFLGRTHKNKKDNQTWPSDRISSCPKFRELSKKDKADLLEKHKSCAR